MYVGEITSYIDAAQLVLYAFWVFFAGLIFYLRREDKREGYPLESDLPDDQGKLRYKTFSIPPLPEPKTFRMADGSIRQAPNGVRDTREIRAMPVAPWPGAPLQPTGDPLNDAVGPASYAERADVPDMTYDGRPKIVPLRVATDHAIEARDPDPRGMPVITADRRVAGTVRDAWVDRSEPHIRYLEIAVDDGARSVLLPMYLARVERRRGKVRVAALLAHQLAAVPALANPDQITRREEDRISAYCGGGHLYATPGRTESLL